MKIIKNKIFFESEKLPYNIMASSDLFIIASRKLNKRQDADLLWYQVEMQAYWSFTEAYKECKDLPIYTIIDLKRGERGRSNMIFDDTDYFDKESCSEALKRLEKGEMEISRRNMIQLEEITIRL